MIISTYSDLYLTQRTGAVESLKITPVNGGIRKVISYHILGETLGAELLEEAQDEEGVHCYRVYTLAKQELKFKANGKIDKRYCPWKSNKKIEAVIPIETLSKNKQ